MRDGSDPIGSRDVIMRCDAWDVQVPSRSAYRSTSSPRSSHCVSVCVRRAGLRSGLRASAVALCPPSLHDRTAHTPHTASVCRLSSRARLESVPSIRSPLLCMRPAIVATRHHLSLVSLCSVRRHRNMNCKTYSVALHESVSLPCATYASLFASCAPFPFLPSVDAA